MRHLDRIRFFLSITVLCDEQLDVNGCRHLHSCFLLNSYQYVVCAAYTNTKCDCVFEIWFWLDLVFCSSDKVLKFLWLGWGKRLRNNFYCINQMHRGNNCVEHVQGDCCRSRILWKLCGVLPFNGVSCTLPCYVWFSSVLIVAVIYCSSPDSVEIVCCIAFYRCFSLVLIVVACILVWVHINLW